MAPIPNTGSVPKTVTWYWHFVCTFFHMAGHFTKKCFYFMTFDCYKLKLSVSKNWQLFSNFNTHQFWSQKQLKANWAHFFEHKERPQCANIWQSLAMLETLSWPTLSQRRLHARLSMLFKIHHNLVAIDASHILSSKQHNTPTRTENTLAYHIPQSRTEYHRNTRPTPICLKLNITSVTKALIFSWPKHLNFKTCLFFRRKIVCSCATQLHC